MSLKKHLQSLGHSTATVKIHEDAAYSFCNWCADENLEAHHATYSEILSYIKQLQRRGLKQRTVQMQVNSLGHYFKWLISCGVREDEPTQGIEVKGVQRKFLYSIITMQELESVYEKFTGNENYLSGKYELWEKQQHYSQKMQKVVFGLMIWQGLGVGELGRLTLNDVKLREGKIYIAGDRKSNDRTLKLESVQILDVMDYLHDTRPEYLRTNPKQTESLFVTRNGGQWGSNFMSYLLESVTSFNPQITKAQQIRASVITHWLKNNNLRQAQYMAGHRYVSSTESYLINDLEDLQEDITRFHPMG